MSSVLRVAVGMATVWTSPEAPRDLDAAAVADRPDVLLWPGGLTPAARLGLHGRTLTQLQAGEPVTIVEDRGDWVRVAALWQPNPGDDQGYLGWVRRAHLRDEHSDDAPHPVAEIPADRVAILDGARRHLGLTYLWGGTTPAGLDCSGLVHTAYRRAGIVVPRDADAQQRAAQPVAAGEEQPGDLYFFGSGLESITHVGFVVTPGHLLHSPEDAAEPGAGVVVEEPLSDSLAALVVAVGRFPV